MVEVVLHQISGTVLDIQRITSAGPFERAGQAPLPSELGNTLFKAIPKVGVTTEELYDAVASQPEFQRIGLPPLLFFQSLILLLEAGFVRTSVRQVAAA